MKIKKVKCVACNGLGVVYNNLGRHICIRCGGKGKESIK